MRPTTTRLARTFQSTKTRRRREQYMLLVALCRRHFSADFIICMCEFDFRQAQGIDRVPLRVERKRIGRVPAFDLDDVIDELLARRTAARLRPACFWRWFSGHRHHSQHRNRAEKRKDFQRLEWIESILTGK